MGQWTKNIGFCQILSGRNVKSEFYVSLGKLWGEFFFGTINLIYYLRTSSELFLSLCWKLVRRGSHNYKLHVHGKILMESSISSEKILFLSSSHHYRCSSAFWQTFPAGLPKMQSSCPQKHSEEKSFSGKLLCYHFYHILTANFSANCQFFWLCR